MIKAVDESNVKNEQAVTVAVASLNENNFVDQFSAFPVDPGYNNDGSNGTGQLFSGGDPI